MPDRHLRLEQADQLRHLTPYRQPVVVVVADLEQMQMVFLEDLVAEQDLQILPQLEDQVHPAKEIAEEMQLLL